MTAVQLALDACDPAWQPVPQPLQRRRKHPRLTVLEPHQLTRKQRRRMTTIQPDARYL